MDFVKRHRNKIGVGVVLIVGLVAIFFFIYRNYLVEPSVMGSISENDTVTVGATVSPCTLDLTIYPEKRVPRTDNWQTELTVQVYDVTESNLFGTLTGVSDQYGRAVFDLCAEGISIANGDYLMKIRGKSHLFKDFIVLDAWATAGEELILIAPEDRLLAGETSIIFDNYVNALDFSPMISNFYTANDDMDLNQDGIVNSLDISNSIYNYRVEGE